ncbi:MAG TPA: Chromate resistance protein ChrB [Bradyrhizobium sp.]|nr:Chromate resistance protein ChrB [Bradyrhizobium sp.]
MLLTHQLPAKPAYTRVKIWRRLQAIGAVSVKNSVYALPAGEQAQEDFEWLLKEVQEQGGEGLICEAKLVGGLSDQDIEELFRRARDTDYEELAKEAQALARSLDALPPTQPRAEGQPQLKRLKARRDHVVAIDFFGANGRDAVDGLLAGLEERLREEPAREPEASDPEEGGGDDPHRCSRAHVGDP